MIDPVSLMLIAVGVPGELPLTLLSSFRLENFGSFWRVVRNIQEVDSGSERAGHQGLLVHPCENFGTVWSVSGKTGPSVQAAVSRSEPKTNKRILALLQRMLLKWAWRPK